MKTSNLLLIILCFLSACQPSELSIESGPFCDISAADIEDCNLPELTTVDGLTAYLIGEWQLVIKRGGQLGTPLPSDENGTLRCGIRSPLNERFTFTEDGLLLYRPENGMFTDTARYRVELDDSEVARLRIEGNIGGSMNVTHRCANNLAYSDYTFADGLFCLYHKE